MLDADIVMTGKMQWEFVAFDKLFSSSLTSSDGIRLDTIITDEISVIGGAFYEEAHQYG